MPETPPVYEPRPAKKSTLSCHWKLAVCTAAGIATVTAGVTLADREANPPATQASPATSDSPADHGGATTPTSAGENGDVAYWAEHAGNHGSPREEGTEGKHPGAHDGKGEEDDSGHEDSDGKHDGGHEHEGGHDKTHVDCDPNDLIQAVTAANQLRGPDHLTLAGNCTYTLTTNQDGNGFPVITQPITIDGNGATLARAANAADFRFFEVGAGGDLKLRNLTLTRGKAPEGEDGGAILVRPAGRLDLKDTEFTHNSVTEGEGGALYNEGVATIRQSTLSRNSASDEAEGGAITNEGDLNISQSTISHNTASGAVGGGISNETTMRIGKSLISHNFSSDQGGGIQTDGLAEIEQSTLSHNTARSGGGIHHGSSEGTGALYARGNTISGNTATESGGGLHAELSAVIEDNDIKDNRAVSGNGGGVEIESIDFDLEVAIRDSKVSGNQAPAGVGGGIIIDADPLVAADLALTDVKVTRNLSDEPAGGIHNDGGTVTTYGRIHIVDNVPTNCAGSPSPVPHCFG
ncbi:right-handed parallel beta-helix repeat-containing protein [Streptomyces sp. WMMC940]|uniref:right-handed parallel beta-helix repeat-containing protein n=1 Tax=Streptomyces sp. WMMC940 TaxID=3015153 RepID=UPI0022B5F752|nr:right-handed parallel beta-helix repeat-containing protein [Streptomyces sp. WMMC940]MCZ7456224.1 right-handed parallel beta-helix repeat-containing protein [Streptomyces sp. WMMC940]